MEMQNLGGKPEEQKAKDLPGIIKPNPDLIEPMLSRIDAGTLSKLTEDALLEVRDALPAGDAGEAKIDTGTSVSSSIEAKLGRNFLAAEAWKKFGVKDVGGLPEIPKGITEELLESRCPFNPEKKIKETHVLVLVPQAVDGRPYSALELGKRCAGKTGAGEKLIASGIEAYDEWKQMAWARNAQAASRWAFMPMIDVDPQTGNGASHFRKKLISEQDRVLREEYPQFRGAGVLETMTMHILFDAVNGALNGERLSKNVLLRCNELGPDGGRASVGWFSSDGLLVSTGRGVLGWRNGEIGRALALKI